MPAAFIEVLIPIQESERSCIRVLGVMYMCVRDVDFVSVAMIFLLAFRIVPTQWCFFPPFYCVCLLIVCSFWAFIQIMFSFVYLYRGRRGRDRMVIGFKTTHATSAYHH